MLYLIPGGDWGAIASIGSWARENSATRLESTQQTIIRGEKINSSKDIRQFDHTMTYLFRLPHAKYFVSVVMVEGETNAYD